MTSKYDWLIVGAGLTGSVIAERLANEYDKKVLVIDRRDHIGGNVYDERNEHGILYHKYGPHIFHTNSQKVVRYLSRFTEWIDYEHRVVGVINDRLVPIPFNLTSIEILFPDEAEDLKAILIDTYGLNVKIPILQLMNSEDKKIKKLSKFIYDNVFLGYTTKQWGMRPEELDPSVTARVPIHISYDDRYFQDSFQKMPKEGYTSIFKKMLDNQNIDLLLNIDFKDISSSFNYDKMVFTGMIDEYFHYMFGELPYRSLHFEFHTYHQTHHQPLAQVNYPVSQDFTRITEMGYLTGEWGGKTTIAIEYPKSHVTGKTIPYYPIPQKDNEDLFLKYKLYADANLHEVYFAGRLGDYKYYNMDQTIDMALALSRKLGLI